MTSLRISRNQLLVRRVCLNIAGSLLQKLKNYFTEDEFWPCGELVVIPRKPFLPNLPPNKRVSYDLSPFIEKNVMLIMKRVKLFAFFMWFRLMPLRKVRSVAYFCQHCGR